MTLFFKKGLVPRVEEVMSHESSCQRILVVDDDHLSVQNVSRMMEALGSKVDAANGGDAALNCLSQSRYDVVITNLEMPDLNGYDLACWVKEKSSESKVIIMTGRSHSEVTHYMKSRVVDCWLFKPFSIGDLEAALNNIMQLDLQESSCMC